MLRTAGLQVPRLRTAGLEITWLRLDGLKITRLRMAGLQITQVRSSELVKDSAEVGLAFKSPGLSWLACEMLD